MKKKIGKKIRHPNMTNIRSQNTTTSIITVIDLYFLDIIRLRK